MKNSNEFANNRKPFVKPAMEYISMTPCEILVLSDGLPEPGTYPESGYTPGATIPEMGWGD